MRRFWHSNVGGLALRLGVLLYLACIKPAHAAYDYLYVGRSFTTTYISYNNTYPPGDGPSIYAVDAYVTVRFSTPTKLTAGVSLADGIAFTIGLSSDGAGGGLPYPYPYPRDPANPDNPSYEGVFNILSVDDKGLPTDWLISVDYAYRAPTARLSESFVRTSTNLDDDMGGYEGFSEYHGFQANNPGTWTVTAVPEPDAAWMLLLGLGVLGLVVRHQSAVAPA